MTTVIHLIDDTNAGGVMRVLDTLRDCPRLGAVTTHRIVPVRRGFIVPPRLDADIIVSHLSVNWRALLGLTALRAAYPRTRLIHVEHSYSRSFMAHNVTASARFRALLRTTLALFDDVVAVSDDQGRWLVDRGLVEPEALTVIRSAVDTAALARLPAVSGRPRVIGAIGRFDRQKGFDILIEAFRQISDPDVELHLVGDGPERADLEARAAGDPRIRFAGFTDDPVSAYAGFDAVAMPSRWEPYGLVAVEARAARRPVLVADVDGLRDHTGAIPVRSHGVAVWTEALEALLDGSVRPDLEAARADALQSQDRFVESWLDLCKMPDARVTEDADPQPV